jgi:hypothetical protein
MLAGIKLLKGTGTTIGAIQVRDNKIDGAAAAFRSDATGSSDWPDAYPLFSGNITINCTTDFTGGIATWVTENTGDAETISSGALSNVRRVTFITTANTVAYTYPDPLVDGFIKCFKIKSVSGSPAGTLTPTHLADGSSHTITWSAAGGYACLVWDATATTNRVLSSSGVTVN